MKLSLLPWPKSSSSSSISDDTPTRFVLPMEISRQELVAVLRRLGYEVPSDDVLDALVAIAAKAEACEEEELKMAFKVFDADAAAMVTKKEHLIKVFDTDGPATAGEKKRPIKVFDADGTKIKEEFKDAFKLLDFIFDADGTAIKEESMEALKLFHAYGTAAMARKKEECAKVFDADGIMAMASEIKEAFKVFDADGDGRISAKKLGDVLVDMGDVPIAANARGRGRDGNLSTMMGIVAASTAVTVLAAGTVSPPVAFGSLLLLIGGLFVSVSGVLNN